MRVGKITLKSWANSISSKITKYHPWNEYHCLRFFLDFLYIRKNISRVEQFQQIERIKTIKHFCPSVLQRGELVLHLVFPNHLLDQTFPFFPFSFSSSFSSYKNRYFYAQRRKLKSEMFLRKRVDSSRRRKILPISNYFRPLFLRRSVKPTDFHDNWKFPGPVTVIVNRKHREVGFKSPEIRISILWIWSNYKSFLQINFHGHYGNFDSASRLVSSVKGLSYFQRFILINDAWTVEIAVEQRMEFLVKANELVAIIRIR